MAKQLKPAIVPELVRFAEWAGSRIAFGMVLPDVNEALAKVRAGCCFPSGSSAFSGPCLGSGWPLISPWGVVREYQRKGIGALLVRTWSRPRTGARLSRVRGGLEAARSNDSVNDSSGPTAASGPAIYRIYEKRLPFGDAVPRPGAGRPARE